jgi:hypothetical protein
MEHGVHLGLEQLAIELLEIGVEVGEAAAPGVPEEFCWRRPAERCRARESRGSGAPLIRLLEIRHCQAGSRGLKGSTTPSSYRAKSSTKPRASQKPRSGREIGRIGAGGKAGFS